jgi:O-methyltransferase
MALYAFDSFEGLPEPTGDDGERHIWKKGKLAVSAAEFQAIMKTMNASLADGDYWMVSGFYRDTLDGHRPADYGIQRAAMVFVQCDHYASAKSVLSFVKDTLVDGGLLVFDDWFMYGGSPKKGERRALAEFLSDNRDIALTEHLAIGWHGKSFVVHR